MRRSDQIARRQARPADVEQPRQTSRAAGRRPRCGRTRPARDQAKGPRLQIPDREEREDGPSAAIKRHLLIADCGLRIADCGLRIADCERLSSQRWPRSGQVGLFCLTVLLAVLIEETTKANAFVRVFKSCSPISSSPFINPQSAFIDPQSAIRNNSTPICFANW